MSPLEREIARQRAELLRIEQNGASELVRTYQHTERQLEANLSELTRQIEDARAAGIEVRPGWLVAQGRYQRLIGDLQRSTLDYLHRAISTIHNGQGAAVEKAPGNGRALTVKALGPGPERAVAQIENRFGRLPSQALENLVGFAGDGNPLGRLLAEIAPATTKSVKDSLAFGVAAGKHPRVIAADVMTKANVSRTRALTIARTETLRAYRTASAMEYRNSQAVETWTWFCAVDERSCISCIAEDGTVHPVTEEFNSHPACRCTQVPNTPSWRELGFPNIPDNRPALPAQGERFASLPPDAQLAIMGRPRLEALHSGEMDLGDLVRQTRSRRWGGGRRPATLTELSLR